MLCCQSSFGCLKDLFVFGVNVNAKMPLTLFTDCLELAVATCAERKPFYAKM